MGQEPGSPQEVGLSAGRWSGQNSGQLPRLQLRHIGTIFGRKMGLVPLFTVVTSLRVLLTHLLTSTL